MSSLESNEAAILIKGKFILKKMMAFSFKRSFIEKKVGFTVPTQGWFAVELLKPASGYHFGLQIDEDRLVSV